MRLVLLTTDVPDQAALCAKLCNHCEVVGVVLSQNVVRRSLSSRFRLLLNRLQGRISGTPFVRAWQDLQQRYRNSTAGFPAVAMLRVRNINDSQIDGFLEGLNPDVVLVSGTNLLGKVLIQRISSRARLINLHTGLSPYIKGGPNCTNWCLAEGQFHLIGNTMMWLDAGIDSGAIIATEVTSLTGRETLQELHWKVIEHAQDLCVRVVRSFAEGGTIPRIVQDDVINGRTFMTREWNVQAMRSAWSNFRTKFRPDYFASSTYKKQISQLRLFPCHKITELSHSP